VKYVFLSLPVDPEHKGAKIGGIAKNKWESQINLLQKKIDVLVNAAGVTHYSPLFVTSPALLDEVVQTNLLGTMMGCRAVGKNMMASKNGGRSSLCANCYQDV